MSNSDFYTHFRNLASASDQTINEHIVDNSVHLSVDSGYAELAGLFLYSYEAEFVQKLLQDKNKKLAVSFNLTYRYIDLTIIIFTIMSI